MRRSAVAAVALQCRPSPHPQPCVRSSPFILASSRRGLGVGRGAQGGVPSAPRRVQTGGPPPALPPCLAASGRPGRLGGRAAGGRGAIALTAASPASTPANLPAPLPLGPVQARPASRSVTPAGSGMHTCTVSRYRGVKVIAGKGTEEQRSKGHQKRNNQSRGEQRMPGRLPASATPHRRPTCTAAAASSATASSCTRTPLLW